MITIFSLPKSFEGHISVIQRNAIQSWKLLNPACEIILFGNDDGIDEAAKKYGVRHFPNVERNEFGTPLLSDTFLKAKSIARFPILCFINSDIILTESLQKISNQIPFEKFLLVGRRWNMDIHELLDFNRAGWQDELRLKAAREGSLFTDFGIDYAVFPKVLFPVMPPFAIGRPAWDNWLLYRARVEGAELIDMTDAFPVIHQNHEYPSHLKDGSSGLWAGPESRRNLELAGDMDYCFHIGDANWVLNASGIHPAGSCPFKSPREITKWLVLNENRPLISWIAKPILQIRLKLRRIVRSFRQEFYEKYFHHTCPNKTTNIHQ